MQLSVFLIALGLAVVTHALKKKNAAKLQLTQNVTSVEDTQNTTSVEDTQNATKLEDEQTAKGLNYLGVGYNLLKGNPDGGAASRDGSDPGLLPTRRIFELTWHQNKMSDDKRYKVPDQVRYYEHSSCAESTTFQMFTGTKSYQQNLKSDVKGEGSVDDTEGLWNAAFSLSHKYSRMNQDTIGGKHVYFEEKKVCNRGKARYQTQLAETLGSRVSKEFASAVCNLPEDFNTRAEQVYQEFVDNWGTHIVEEVELGTRSIARFESSYADIATFAEQQLGLAETVSGGNRELSGSLSAAFEKFSRSDERESTLTKIKTLFISGRDDLPAPIGLKLLPIVRAVSDAFFERLKQKFQCAGSLEQRKTNLKQLLNTYPELKGVTTPYDPDVSIPVEWPLGTYGLPMYKHGCPKGDFWHQGSRTHDTEDVNGKNRWSDDYGKYMAGAVNLGKIQQKFCMKTRERTSSSSLPWPKGQYCIFKKGESCPSGFNQAHLFWDDESLWNSNSRQGVLPEGDYNDYDDTTLIYYCCRTDGFAANEIILPTEKPFVLMKTTKNNECQLVRGMQVTEQWIEFDCDDWNGTHIKYRQSGDIGAEIDSMGNVIIRYCIYYKERY